MIRWALGIRFSTAHLNLGLWGTDITHISKIIGNIMILIPFGLLLHAEITRRCQSLLNMAAFVFHTGDSISQRRDIPR
jgi:glycopeptide antibiotics resistance protein